MSRLLDIYRAGRVRRWHTNEALSGTDDRNDGHSARVARIILALHPDPSAALLTAALTHDDGEIATGDMPGPIKKANDSLSYQLNIAEGHARIDLWGVDTVGEVFSKDREWLDFADKLDAYIWASRQAPGIMGGKGWPEAATWLCHQSSRLGCRDAIHDLMKALP